LVLQALLLYTLLLLLLLRSLVSPSDDVLEVEVFMNEAAMPPTVLVMGLPRLVKALTREDGDIAKFTGGKIMAVRVGLSTSHLTCTSAFCETAG
jgi:hypothetical protein